MSIKQFKKFTTQSGVPVHPNFGHDKEKSIVYVFGQLNGDGGRYGKGESKRITFYEGFLESICRLAVVKYDWKPSEVAIKKAEEMEEDQRLLIVGRDLLQCIKKFVVKDVLTARRNKSVYKKKSVMIKV
eukprot:TRINITY_DN72945_c0_g1_i1.p1 TRINITY_DN72945_c0_g1~~TRINITY_DN72945_c0_g1_i1.p1  ORF type:complete len:139 (-),score=18.20 TRINITY_DN72945_c0_g1_i1:17-403(-)